MSAHAAHRSPATNAPAKARRKGLAALTVSAAGVWLALAATAAPAAAVDQPEPTGPAQSSATMPNPGPPNHPNYNLPDEVPPVEQASGLDATSVALGALGGIALAGAGLGITLGVQRRRDRAALHTA